MKCFCVCVSRGVCVCVCVPRCVCVCVCTCVHMCACACVRIAVCRSVLQHTCKRRHVDTLFKWLIVRSCELLWIWYDAACCNLSQVSLCLIVSRSQSDTHGCNSSFAKKTLFWQDSFDFVHFQKNLMYIGIFWFRLCATRHIACKAPCFYSALQCVTVYSNVLQCIAVYYILLHLCILFLLLPQDPHFARFFLRVFSKLECTEAFCSVLQCVAVCCSVLQCFHSPNWKICPVRDGH